MADDMSDIMGKLNEVLSSNNMPDNIKEIMNNLSNSNSSESNDESSNVTGSSDSNSNDNSSNNSSGLNITPEMISAFMSSFGGTNNSGGSSNESSDDSSGMPNIDMATMMKIANAMGKMNNRDDPRSKLLLSLKPYLRNERKEKVEQYSKFLGMGKMLDIFNSTGGGKSK